MQRLCHEDEKLPAHYLNLLQYSGHWIIADK